jgi:hypothetical protein
MTREKPSLETLWLQNVRTMDTVQIIDRSSNAETSVFYGLVAFNDAVSSSEYIASDDRMIDER